MNLRVKRLVNVSDDRVNEFLEGKIVHNIQTFLDDLSNINYIIVYEEGSD